MVDEVGAPCAQARDQLVVASKKPKKRKSTGMEDPSKDLNTRKPIIDENEVSQGASALWYYASQSITKRHKTDSTEHHDDNSQKSPHLVSNDSDTQDEMELEIEVTTTSDAPGNSVDQFDQSDLNSKQTTPINKGPNVLKNPLSQRGPCKVFIQGDPKSANAKEKLHKLFFRRLINSRISQHGKSVIDIKSNGVSKLCVTLKSALDANNLLEDKSFKDKGYVAFIPVNFCSCQDVIRDIPLDISDNEIKENLAILGMSYATLTVLNVRRHNRKFKNPKSNQFELQPSKSDFVTFSGTSLPESVGIFKASFLVFKYTPQVKMCHNCLRYGHISTQCRSSPRCSHCGGDHLNVKDNLCPNLDVDPKCVHCLGKHTANSKNCKE